MATTEQTLEHVLRQTESLLRQLEDYKTSISFLEAELQEVDFRQQEAQCQKENQCMTDSDMLENAEMDEALVSLPFTLGRVNSVRSRATIGLNQSRANEISMVSSKYETEITELREQIISLEVKNKKYLEVIGMTASEQQENMRLQVEAAQEALTFTKRARKEGSVSNEDIQFLEELENMLEAQQQQMQFQENKISVLSQDLESQRRSNEEKQMVQHKAFD